jgi:hypothetical protein
MIEILIGIGCIIAGLGILGMLSVFVEELLFIFVLSAWIYVAYFVGKLVLGDV